MAEVTGDHNRVAEHLELAAFHRETSGNIDGAVRALIRAGQARTAMGDTENAKKALDRAGALRNPAIRHPIGASHHERLASRAEQSRDVKLAAEHLELAAWNLEKLGDLDGAIRVLDKAGAARTASGDTESAKEASDWANVLRKSAQDPALGAAHYQNMASHPLRRHAIALAITSPIGRGTQSDAALVATCLEKLPVGLLQYASDIGVRVLVCHDSVTDGYPELRGVRPRGWPPWKTWDSALGTTLAGVVTIATQPGGPGEPRHMPGPRDGYLGPTLFLHELGHGIDLRLGGAFSHHHDFIAAYEADRAVLGQCFGEFLLQPPPTGYEEAFAETFALFFTDDAFWKELLRSRIPHLQAYWTHFQEQFVPREEDVVGGSSLDARGEHA